MNIENEETIEVIEKTLENTRWFKIKFYHKGQGREVTRCGTWNDKCKVWITKGNELAICYNQVDEDHNEEGFRTATNVMSIDVKPKSKSLFDTEPRTWDNISRLN